MDLYLFLYKSTAVVASALMRIDGAIAASANTRMSSCGIWYPKSDWASIINGVSIVNKINIVRIFMLK